jgi:hypothetical protein
VKPPGGRCHDHDDHPLAAGHPGRVRHRPGAGGRGAAIIAVDYDDGWLYQLDVVAGDHAADHRNEAGELWVCDFEVRAVGDHQPRV